MSRTLFTVTVPGWLLFLVLIGAALGATWLIGIFGLRPLIFDPMERRMMRRLQEKYNREEGE